MANAYKVLGQAAPGATSETTLFTATGEQVVASTLMVCNRGSSQATYRVSVSVGGGATANKDYLVYDATIDANDALPLTIGMTLADTDVVRVYASSANLSFNLFGYSIA